MLQREISGELQLVEYLTPASGPATATGLRTALRQRLPDYMIPAAFGFLEGLPLTANGKLDRAALPAPDVSGESAFRSPQSANERELAALFGRLTGARSVGLDDSFFDLGGHSLLGLTLLYEVEKAFGQKLPLGVLFAAPTVAGLAARLHGPEPRAGLTSLLPLSPGGDGPPIFMIHWIERDLARRLAVKHPIYGLAFGRRPPAARPEIPEPLSVEALARHYVAEMRAIQSYGPYRLLGHSAGGLAAFEMARQLVAAGEAVGFVGMLDTLTPSAYFGRPRVSWWRAARNIVRAPPAIVAHYGLNYLRDTAARSPLTRWMVSASLPDAAVVRLRRINVYMADYAPAPYAGRVHLFKSARPQYPIFREPPPPREQGWRPLALGGVEVLELPGDHMDMAKDPLAANAAAAILAAIAEG